MATKIDIISGFLGAGKTTLIKKLLKEAYADEQVVLIENEFGEIGIDGGFLKEAGIQMCIRDRMRESRLTTKIQKRQMRNRKILWSRQRLWLYSMIMMAP